MALTSPPSPKSDQACRVRRPTLRRTRHLAPSPEPHRGTGLYFVWGEDVFTSGERISEKPLDRGLVVCHTVAMEITVIDQRKGGTEVSIDLDRVYILAEKAGIPDGTEVRIRLRDGHGPYGYTQKIGHRAYRVVLNIRNPKPFLSDGARYVVNNTLLHELRHVAQGEAKGWQALDPGYQGWSETEAREYGRTIKGQSEFFALA